MQKLWFLIWKSLISENSMVFLKEKAAWILLVMPLLTSCGKQEPALVFSFHLKDIAGYIPSNQIAIWMEKENGDHVKTFFLCDYLAYGGFTNEDICPDWQGRRQWVQSSEEVIDAVSQATPTSGDVSMHFDFPAGGISPGKYRYCIEIHVKENYNELYCGEMEINARDSVAHIGEPEITYLPEKYSEGSGLLSNINVTYRN